MSSRVRGSPRELLIVFEYNGALIQIGLNFMLDAPYSDLTRTKCWSVLIVFI